MLGRKPLFPGRDFIHTLNLVCRVTGTPTEADIAGVPSDKARNYLSTMPAYPKMHLDSLFPEAPPLALDLIDKLLTFKCVIVLPCCHECILPSLYLYCTTLARHARGPSFRPRSRFIHPHALLMLLCSPANRLTAAQALAHPYFAGLYDPTDEPVHPVVLPPDPELDEMPVSQVKAAMLKEMLTYNPDLQYLT